MSIRDQRIAEIADLRARGLTLDQVAGELGISPSTVRGYVYDPDGSKARARKMKGSCVDCGTPIRSDCPGRNPQLRCIACNLRPELHGPRIREAHAYHAEPRRQHIVKRWNEGATMTEIAAELGSTANSIGVALHRLRREGYDLPFRRPDIAKVAA